MSSDEKVDEVSFKPKGEKYRRFMEIYDGTARRLAYSQRSDDNWYKEI